MIKNIVLDIGNVLVHFRWYELMVELGFNEEVIERLKEGMVCNHLWCELDRGVMSDEQVIEGFKENCIGYEEYIDEFLGHKSEIIETFEYAKVWIKDLKERGYKIYLLSNYPRTFFECHLKGKFDFLSFVDGRVVSGYVQMVKPEKKIYEHLLEKYGLKAEECIFIDDTECNIFAAREVGMNGIVFKSYEQTIKELEDCLLT